MTRPEPQDRVVWALRRAFLRVEARKEELMRDLPITPAQYAIMVNVAGQPGLAAAELARRLQVSPQNVAVLVAGLLDRGLLLRRPHAVHRNVRELYLTDIGRDLLTAADERVDQLEAELRTLLGPAGAAGLRDELERVARWDTSAD